MTDEAHSKDRYFTRLGSLAEEMIAEHGKDFAMGALILAARFIAEGKPLGARGETPHDPSQPERFAGTSQAGTSQTGTSQAGT